MKKIIVIILLLLPFWSSCQNETRDKERIRLLAIENYVDEFVPINRFLKFYVCAYYAMPSDYDEFMSFIKEYKKRDPFFYEWEKREGYDIIKTISNSNLLFAAYQDSVFFYLPDYHVGSSVIGTPFYWLENPDKWYPRYPNRLDYDSWFFPSAYDKKGKYLFDSEFHYRRFEEKIDSISSQYTCRITHEGYFYTGFPEGPQIRQMPYLSIVSFSRTADSVELLSRTASTDSLFIFDANDLTYQPVKDSLPNLCKEYMDETVSVLKKVFEENPDVERITMGLNWYCYKDSTKTIKIEWQ